MKNSVEQNMCTVTSQKKIYIRPIRNAKMVNVLS